MKTALKRMPNDNSLIDVIKQANTLIGWANTFKEKKELPIGFSDVGALKKALVNAFCQIKAFFPKATITIQVLDLAVKDSLYDLYKAYCVLEKSPVQLSTVKKFCDHFDIIENNVLCIRNLFDKFKLDWSNVEKNIGRLCHIAAFNTFLDNEFEPAANKIKQAYQMRCFLLQNLTLPLCFLPQSLIDLVNEVDEAYQTYCDGKTKLEILEAQLKKQALENDKLVSAAYRQQKSLEYVFFPPTASKIRKHKGSKRNCLARYLADEKVEATKVIEEIKSSSSIVHKDEVIKVIGQIERLKKTATRFFHWGEPKGKARDIKEQLGHYLAHQQEYEGVLSHDGLKAALQKPRYLAFFYALTKQYANAYQHVEDISTKTPPQ